MTVEAVALVLILVSGTGEVLASGIISNWSLLREMNPLVAEVH